MPSKSMLAGAVVAIAAAAACKPKDAAPGSAAGSSAAPATPVSKDGLVSAAWKNDKGPGKAGPLVFDRQIWADDGNGNLQLWLIASCPKLAKDCSMVKSSMLQPDALEAACKGWSMVHIAFAPSKDQKAGMGPLKLTPGSYGNKSEPITAFVEYTNSDRSIGGQSYQDKDQLSLTQVTDTTLAGTFDTKYNDYAFKGGFTATRCACDDSGACK